MVDLLILKNRVGRLRNVQIWVSAVLDGGRSADIQEFDIMLQNVQICNVSKCNGVYLMIVIHGILAAKSSDKSSTLLQEGRFADAQE